MCERGYRRAPVSTVYNCSSSHSTRKERLITRPAKLGCFLPVAWRKSQTANWLDFSRGKKKRSKQIFHRLCALHRSASFPVRVRWGHRGGRELLKQTLLNPLNQRWPNFKQHHHQNTSLTTLPQQTQCALIFPGDACAAQETDGISPVWWPTACLRVNPSHLNSPLHPSPSLLSSACQHLRFGTVYLRPRSPTVGASRWWMMRWWQSN